MAQILCRRCGELRRHVSRNLCNACYKAARLGDQLENYPRINYSTSEWFAVSRGEVGQCWPWKGPVDRDGYGVGSRCRAHTWSYEQFVGPVPEGLQLDHGCSNRLCVNPEHLTPMTGRENVLRGKTIPAANLAKTHCAQGHEFTPANTYVSPGTRRRQCRTCKSEWQAKARRRR